VVKVNGLGRSVGAAARWGEEGWKELLAPRNCGRLLTHRVPRSSMQQSRRLPSLLLRSRLRWQAQAGVASAADVVRTRCHAARACGLLRLAGTCKQVPHHAPAPPVVSDIRRDRLSRAQAPGATTALLARRADASGLLARGALFGVQRSISVAALKPQDRCGLSARGSALLLTPRPTASSAATTASRRMTRRPC